MIRRSLLVLLLALGFAVPARAQDPLASVRLGAPDPVSLRRDLARFSTSASPADSVAVAAAWDLVAVSYQRAGMADSAIACWQRSLAAHAGGEPADALIEACFTRRGPDDLATARVWIARRFQMMRFDAGPFDQGNNQGRLGWALFLDGRADSARKVFQRARGLLDETNPMRWVWRRRIGMAAHAAGDRDRALEMAKDLTVRARMQDRDALQLLHDVLGGSEGDNRYAPFLRTELIHDQKAEQDRLDQRRVRRVDALGVDGFPLGGVLFAPARTRRVVVAIAADDDDDFARYDSLAADLGRGGYALVLMDPRGSGHSRAPACPTRESWTGREEAIESAVAADVRRMFAAVARELKTDSSGYTVLGTQGSAAIAVEAAMLDRRVRSLVLLSPLPPPVELGRMAARLRAHRVPTFVETAPSDIGAAAIGAQLYDSLDPKTSRLTDSEATGRGPVVFRYDGTAAPRLMGWLAEHSAAPVAPRPAPPRRK